MKQAEGTKAASLRILLVDDHVVVREGLKGLISSWPGLQVVGEASTGREALAEFMRLRPDITLLDLRLPDVAGTGVIRALLAEDPEARILILSAHGGEADIRCALQAGARGYLLKDSPGQEILAAIRCVARGIPFVSQLAAARLASGSSVERLTAREQQILELVADGLNNSEIALTLDLGVGTVKIHIHNVLGKLGARDRAQAIAMAHERGLIRSK